MIVFTIIHVPGCVCLGSEVADEASACPNVSRAAEEGNIACEADVVETLVALVLPHYPHGFGCLDAAQLVGTDSFESAYLFARLS